MSSLFNQFLTDLALFLESQEKIDEIYFQSSSSANGFEKLVSKTLQSKTFTKIKFSSELNYGHHFPDINIYLDGKKYGLELKSRSDGSWKNNGGSIFESFSEADYETIYLLFGTYNKKMNDHSYQVRYAPYWSVIKDLKVTHSPRYIIDMDTENPLFKNDYEYNKIRTMTEQEKVSYIQQKLQAGATKPAWYLADNSNIKPVPLNSLAIDVKNRLIAEVLILYPQNLLQTDSAGHSRANYQQISEYFIETYFYYTSSLRDFFSAGGTIEINNVLFPKIIGKLIAYKDYINQKIKSSSTDFQNLAYLSWPLKFTEQEQGDFLKNYCTVLNFLGAKYFSTKIKEAGFDNLLQLLTK